jgi:hypothetical protein
MLQGMSTAATERKMVEMVGVQPVRECKESP